MYFSHVSEFAIEFEHCKKIAKKGVNMKTKQKKKENVEWNYFRSIGWQIFATFVCHESGRDIFGAQKLMTIAAR